MTIRFKLTTAVIAVILVANSVLSFITLYYLGQVWLQEVQTRVQRNLNSARAVYDQQAEVMAAFLEGTALNRKLVLAAEPDNGSAREGLLQQLRGAGQMDFVALLDAHGRVLCRSGGSTGGDDLSADPLIARVLGERRTATGTLIYSRERLLTEGEELAAQAHFELIPTPAARPTDETVSTDGMVLAAAVPVLDAQGRMQAILHAGNLINRRYEIADAIKKDVFPGETYRGKDIGTVTIFSATCEFRRT